jgi:lipid-binding SYLF domain-containing protein
MLRTVSLSMVMTLLVAATQLAGCETAPRTAQDREQLKRESEAAITAFRNADPTIGQFFDNAHGYAVFPSVGKGAIGVGGAYGRGIAYERGRPVGYCDLSQGTIGLQLGGQTYREVIFFETEEAFLRFRRGNFALAAQASAVAATAGAAANANYEQGVAVFTLPHGGLMFEASVGGQQFTFEPMD